MPTGDPTAAGTRSSAVMDDGGGCRPFHTRLLTYSCGGPFCDGHVLSIIAIALPSLALDLHLAPGTWLAGSHCCSLADRHLSLPRGHRSPRHLPAHRGSGRHLSNRLARGVALCARDEGPFAERDKQPAMTGARSRRSRVSSAQAPMASRPFQRWLPDGDLGSRAAAPARRMETAEALRDGQRAREIRNRVSRCAIRHRVVH